MEPYVIRARVVPMENETLPGMLVMYVSTFYAYLCDTLRILFASLQNIHLQEGLQA